MRKFKVFEQIDNITYILRYETDDLDFCTKILNAYKCKYVSRKFILVQYII